MEGKKVMTSFHSKIRRKTEKMEQFKNLYHKLMFKRIVVQYYFLPLKAQKNDKKNKKGKSSIHLSKLGKENKYPAAVDIFIEPVIFPASVFLNQSVLRGVELKTDTTFYGCEKNTKSCIGQIYNGKPFYLYINRQTPPCCRKKLQTVFQYLIEELMNSGVRFWLDNLALKDAIELNDLSSDAFEIDISFNVNDYNRSTALKRCFDSRPYTDLAGFYWIKATDGQYLKVQFSKINDIHVNLLPFEVNNEKVVPKGFYGPKAIEFSIEFLHPLSNIYFLGCNVFAPNNAREYLMHKGLIN